MQRFTRNLVTITTLVVVLTSAASAFDNERKGFVIGAGAGYSPSIKTTVDATAPAGFGQEYFLGSAEGDEPGVGLQLMLGFGFSERDMIVAESNMGWFYYKNVPIDFETVSDVQILQGTHTISWYHYYGATGGSFFTMVGGGFGYFDTDYSNVNSPGPGYIVGAGFELTQHVQIGAYWSSFQTSNSDLPPLQLDGTHSNISVLLSFVAY